MRTLALLLICAAVVVAQDTTDKVALEYKFDNRRPHDVSLNFTLGLKFEGSETAIDYISSSSPFFSFEKIQMESDGVIRNLRSRRGSDSGRIRLRYDEARISGVYDDEDYEYDFKRGVQPEDLEEDKLKGFVWIIFWAGKTFELTKDGEYKSEDKNQDAGGEVMDIIQLGVTRLPSVPISIGAEWEKTYKTKNRQKEDKARFELTQKSKLVKLEDGKATIKSTLTGKAVDGEAKENAYTEDAKSTVKGEMTIVLDTKSGRVISWKSKGEIRYSFKGADPNSGEDLDLEIILTIKSELSPRD